VPFFAPDEPDDNTSASTSPAATSIATHGQRRPDLQQLDHRDMGYNGTFDGLDHPPEGDRQVRPSDNTKNKTM
jgi:hypothetical protein